MPTISPYRILALMPFFAGYRKLLSPLGSAGSKNTSAVGRRHSFPETVLISSFSLRWLECTFHFNFYFLKQGCKCSKIPSFRQLNFKNQNL
jgi:hypothetical protein